MILPTKFCAIYLPIFRTLWSKGDTSFITHQKNESFLTSRINTSEKKKCSAHLFWGQDLGRDQKSIFLVLYCCDLYSIEHDHLLDYNQHYMTLAWPELDPNSFINMYLHIYQNIFRVISMNIFSYYYFIYYFYFSEKSCHFKLKPQSHLFCTYWKNAACKSLPTEAWKFEISQILRKMLSAIGLLLGHVALRPIPQLRIYIYWSILIIFQTNT